MPIDDVVRKLSVDHAWSHIERITREIPSRLAGSDNGRRMAEYARDAFAKAGLDSRIHEFRGLVSFPKDALVRVIAPEQRNIPANTLGHSASTPGIEGELVYVASGGDADYAGRDVRGKLTLSELSY